MATAMPVDNQHQPANTAQRVEWARGGAWISEGFELFKAAPGVWIGITALWAVILFGLAMLPFGSLIWTLFSPVLTGGALLGCHALHNKQALKLEHLFTCFRGGHLGPLVTLGLLGLAAQVVIALLAGGLIFSALPAGALGGHMGLGAVASLPVLLGVLVGVLLMVPLAMALWFAPALVALNQSDPVPALKQSFAASWYNMGAFTVYGLLMLGIVLIASIPFGLGLLVAGPVLVGSIYAGYRDIFHGDGQITGFPA